MFKNMNAFSLQDDLALGKQVSGEIDGNSKEYPVLAEAGNEKIYGYVRGITQKLLNSGQVAHRDQFPWVVKIINDDKTLNAFCTPGGYIYVYTGLIKFLDSEDQLAGVMGHEIAHAANRHSTKQMTKQYGLSALAMVAVAATGEKNQETKALAAQMAMGLATLRFSRDHEREADASSVNYLCATDYNASGTAGFFKKMEGNATPPQFLSTHPNPGNRVKDIEAKAVSMGCKGTNFHQAEYNKMKALLR
jgi:beta-barrel assembly-enhancing protease